MDFGARLLGVFKTVVVIVFEPFYVRVGVVLTLFVDTCILWGLPFEGAGGFLIFSGMELHRGLFGLIDRDSWHALSIFSTAMIVIRALPEIISL